MLIAVMLGLAVSLFQGTTDAAGHAMQVNVTGSIWLDLNMNGQRDANDTVYTDCIVFMEEVVPEDSDVIGTAVAFGDQDGRFEFFDVKPGQYLIWAEMGDHASVPISITVAEDITQTAPIELLMPPYTNFLPLLIGS